MEKRKHGRRPTQRQFPASDKTHESVSRRDDIKRLRIFGWLVGVLMVVAIAYHFGWQREQGGRELDLVPSAKAETFVEGGTR